MDGYACLISLQVLTLFSENDIIVSGLPAQTSHFYKL